MVKNSLFAQFGELKGAYLTLAAFSVTIEFTKSRFQTMGVKESIAQTLDGKGAFGPWCVTVIVLLVVVSTASYALSTVESLQGNDFLFSFIESFSILAFTIEYLLRSPRL